MREPALQGPVGSGAAAPPGAGIVRTLGRVVLLLAMLYAFLGGVDLIGTGMAGLGSGTTDQLFRGISNPVLGLFVGILATVLVQSSSISTATVVGMVGAGVLDVNAAVPIIMGANVGTTVTSTLASMASIRRPREFQLAFTGATMHDAYNLLCVAVLLPLEIATGLLGNLAVALSRLFTPGGGSELSSPIKGAVDAATDVVVTGAQALPLNDFSQALALLGAGLAVIFGALYVITKTMKGVMAGPAERSLNRVLRRSGLLGIMVGLLLTVAVQSSSIATSLLIPLIAAGVLELDNAYPITLGANVGTTVTALIAALAVTRIEGLQIALVHLLFNCAGVLLFYPVPALRRLPVALATRIAGLAVRNRSLAIAYVAVAFYVVPFVAILVLR